MSIYQEQMFWLIKRAMSEIGLKGQPLSAEACDRLECDQIFPDGHYLLKLVERKGTTLLKRENIPALTVADCDKEKVADKLVSIGCEVYQSEKDQIFVLPTEALKSNLNAVHEFARSMEYRLAEKTPERGDGWMGADPDHLDRLLNDAFQKRRMVDIAIYAMMIAQNSFFDGDKPRSHRFNEPLRAGHAE